MQRNSPTVRPPPAALHEALRRLAIRIGAFGPFNFLLSNGDWLFAHCSTKLAYIIRQAPFAVAHLFDEDLSVDFSEVTSPADRVAIIATTPLTDNEVWHTITPGTLLAFRHGEHESLGETATLAAPVSQS